MELQDLSKTSKVKQINTIMESYFGNSFSFNRLTGQQTLKMLSRVRSMINEHRTSSRLHTSERNPAYLKLIMLEQALKARLEEYTPGEQKNPPGAAAKPVYRGAPTEKAQAVREAKKKRRIKEASELQQAQVVLASQDMIDQIQKMLEDVSEMQFKDLPALVDQAKAEVGPGNATQFQQAATEALTALLQALQQGKTAMEGAQGALTGQAPTPIPGAEAGADMAPPAAGEMGVEEMPPELPEPAEPEPPLRGRSLGRGRR